MESAYGEKSAKSTTEFKVNRRILLKEKNGVQKIIDLLTIFVKRYPRRKALKEQLTYFTNHAHQCQYYHYRKKGYPIGSGIVEATCKTVVSQRMKCSGMSWLEKGGQAILTFRPLALSNMFDDAWNILSQNYLKTGTGSGILKQ